MDRRIAHLHARQILDSRGRPTIEVDVTTQGGAHGRASVPSGASTGQFEACELRDKADKRFHGYGVFQALRNIQETIAPRLIGLDVFGQKHIDDVLIELDHTPRKSRLGANALLGVSLAVSRAAAEHAHLPLYRYLGGLAHTLPIPFINVINGGCHASNPLDFQEFMLVPTGADHFGEAIRQSCEVFYSLAELLQRDGLSTSVGDEGGFAPELSSTKQALDYLARAIEAAGYRVGDDFQFALDVAASELFAEGKYQLKGEAKQLSSAEMVSYLTGLTRQYPIISIEDGLSDEDWAGFSSLVKSVSSTTQVVGDDLIVTQRSRLQQAIDQQALTAALIKPNQVGTLSETLECIHAAHHHGLKTMISHRSGDTEDTYIADLCVGTGSRQIKTGSLTRSERTAKYNQLVRIAEDLKTTAVYAGAEL